MGSREDHQILLPWVMTEPPVPGVMEGIPPFRRLLGSGVGDVRSRPNCRLLRESPEHAPKETQTMNIIRRLQASVTPLATRCLLPRLELRVNYLMPSSSPLSTRMSPSTPTMSLSPHHDEKIFDPRCLQPL